MAFLSLSFLRSQNPDFQNFILIFNFPPAFRARAFVLVLVLVLVIVILIVVVVVVDTNPPELLDYDYRFTDYAHRCAEHDKNSCSNRFKEKASKRTGASRPCLTD